MVVVRRYSGLHSTRHMYDGQWTQHATCPNRYVKGLLERVADSQSETRQSPGNGSFCFTPWSTPKFISPPVCPLCAVSMWVYVCVLQPRSIYGLILSSRLNRYIGLRLYTGWPAINQRTCLWAVNSSDVQHEILISIQCNQGRKCPATHYIVLLPCSSKTAFIPKWYLNFFACTTYVKWIQLYNT